MNNSPLYLGKYRNGTARCQNWNYTSNGFYFVTICTKNRLPSFGCIEEYKMIHSNAGTIIKNFWNQIPHHFPLVKLDEYIIMPDHVHGILYLRNDMDCRCVSLKRTYNTPTCIEKNLSTKMSDISPSINSLSLIIRTFKGECTKQIRTFNPDFQWQARFHDRIIRNNNELNRIRLYIRENPKNWYGADHNEY